MALKFLKITKSAIRKLSVGNRLIEHGITFERFKNGDGR